MVKQAQQVKAGEFVNIGEAYLGRIYMVESNPSVPGSVLLQHACGTYELDGATPVDAWEDLPRVLARLPCCVRIEVSRCADRAGLQWTTRHNGRVIDKGFSSASETETRQFAKNMLEAMGLIQDGC
jgi:hypothetical protein